MTLKGKAVAWGLATAGIMGVGGVTAIQVLSDQYNRLTNEPIGNGIRLDEPPTARGEAPSQSQPSPK